MFRGLSFPAATALATGIVLALARYVQAQGIQGIYLNATNVACFSLYNGQELSCMPGGMVNTHGFPENNTWFTFGG